VDADFIGAHAGDLGAILGISRREAMGLALDLWTWALARAKDDAPPDGIITGTGAVPDRLLSGSVGWTGPAEQFTAALVAVGMAVRIEDGYRLTGFSRYRSTWEKNRRRTGGKPDRNRSGSEEKPERKTQTHIEATASQDVSADADPPAAGERPPLTLTAQDSGPKPRAPRKPSAAEALYLQIQEARQARCEAAGVPFTPDRWDNARQNKALGPIAKVAPGTAVDTEGLSEDQRRFNLAFTGFLGDDRHMPKGWPLSLFMSGGVRSRYEQQALMEAAS
jgi:hypothetical protein